MSSIVAGCNTTSRPTASPEKRPSNASWVRGVGRSGGASATRRPSASKSGAQRPPGALQQDRLEAEAGAAEGEEILGKVEGRGDAGGHHGILDARQHRLRQAAHTCRATSA